MEDDRVYGANESKSMDMVIEAENAENVEKTEKAEVTLKDLVLGDTWYKTAFNCVMFVPALILFMLYMTFVNPIVELCTGKVSKFWGILNVLCPILFVYLWFMQ